MKFARRTRLLSVVSFFLVASLLLASLAGCEKPQEAGELSDYDSEAFIPVGDNSVGETTSAGNTNSGSGNPDMSGEETQSGGFVVKDKKYDYEGNNLMILNVENQTDKNYKITINGQYLDESGAVLKEESKTYEGFEAGWSNYFFFVPEIPFERFTYTLDAEEYDGECYATSIKYSWKIQEIERGFPPEEQSRMTEDLTSYDEAIANGQSDAPPPIGNDYFHPAIDLETYRDHNLTENIMLEEDVIILNSHGKICQVRMHCFRLECFAGQSPTQTGRDIYFFPDPDNREWPEDLQGDITVLFSITASYLPPPIPYL